MSDRRLTAAELTKIIDDADHCALPLRLVSWAKLGKTALVRDASGMCLLDTMTPGEPCDFDRWVVAAANAAPALAREVLRLRALVRKKG